METERQNSDEVTLEVINPAHPRTTMSRREAMAMVGKHAVYAAPAVLAVLSVTKSNSAHATVGCSTC